MKGECGAGGGAPTSDTKTGHPGLWVAEQNISRAKVGVGYLLHRRRAQRLEKMKAFAYNAFKKTAEAIMPAPTQSHFKDKKVRLLPGRSAVLGNLTRRC